MFNDDEPKETKTEETLYEAPPEYTHHLLKKRDKVNFPQKEDVVHCWYTKVLQDGTVFDNIQARAQRKKVPWLQVLRWEEAKLSEGGMRHS